MIEKQPKRNLLPAHVIYATGLIDYVFMTPLLTDFNYSKRNNLCLRLSEKILGYLDD